MRVGSNTPVPVDIRLICATNRNLSEMADKGEFREDLLYRINTIHLEIPALRERQEDIIPLAERFITRFCKQYGKPALRLDNAAREKLMLHPWSGNIRELEHAIEKAIIICDNETLPAELFQLARRTGTPEAAASTLEENGNADDFIYIGMNFHWEKRNIALPNLPDGLGWKKVADTSGQTPEQWFGEYEETYKKSIKINPRTIVVLIAKREESGHASMAALQDNNEA